MLRFSSEITFVEVLTCCKIVVKSPEIVFVKVPLRILRKKRMILVKGRCLHIRINKKNREACRVTDRETDGRTDALSFIAYSPVNL